MRTARVFCHYVCNQACTYCTLRKPADDLQFRQTKAVQKRIDEALAQGAQTIVLTGGEPTMRTDLPLLVQYIREKGAQSTLETNATLLDRARAQVLAEAGLGLARVNLTLADDALDALTRDPGGSQRAWLGLEALADAGIPLEISVVIVRSTLQGLARLPEELASRIGASRIRCLEATVPVDSPDANECVDFAQAALALQTLDDAARRVPIPLRLAPGTGLPPCLFPYPGRIAHFYAFGPDGKNRKGFSQVAACTDCAVADRCPGLPERAIQRFGVPDLKPIRGEKLWRRLSIVSRVEEQIERDLVVPSFVKNPDHTPDAAAAEHLIRVNFHCNQSCRFCFVYTHLPPATDERIRQAIRDAAAANARIVLTGGEPTLNPQLAEYVALAKSLTRHPVWLQTNATKLADADLCARLVDAGVSAATVSLHACTPELSDAITEAPGTFVKTIAGLDNLAQHAVKVTLNTVITKRNVHQLVDTVRFAATRWPGFSLNLSFVAPSSELVPRDAEMVPRYGDVALQLSEAWRTAKDLGANVTGVDAQCGLPLCLIPADIRENLELPEVPPGAGGTEFSHAKPCESCALKTKCFGVRRGYLDMYGEADLQPVA